MELLELKKIWQEESQKLEKRITLNEERLRRMETDGLTTISVQRSIRPTRKSRATDHAW